MRVKWLAHKIVLLLVVLLTAPAPAEMVTNWENGFEVDIPHEWLRRDLGADGLKLSQDRVRMQVEPYSGITLEGQIERLHEITCCNYMQSRIQNRRMDNVILILILLQNAAKG